MENMDINKNEKNITTIVNSGKCTGCMACRYACPIDAISIEEKEDTFLYPSVDYKRCLECGKCYGICPNNLELRSLTNESCYAVQANDEIRYLSSSGGVFSVIAEWIISKGGIVCGAAFVEGKVKHIAVDNAADLDRLRKSKYIQSDSSEVYKFIGQALSEKRLVLFTGTPCQCAGVKKIFGDNEDLYMIDILCMGVPSQKMFDRYKMEEIGEDVSYVDFRSKEKNGWTPDLVMSYQGINGKEYIDSTKSVYFDSFLRAYSIRESCTKCNYPGKERIGDITIGDFWGISTLDERLDDKKGTSLLLINSKRGEELIGYVRNKFKAFKMFSLSAVEKINPIIKYPTTVSSKRREFVNEMRHVKDSEKYSTLKLNKADCGIINYWWANDNGAILTAFALQKLLMINGVTSRLINVCPYDQNWRSGGISTAFESQYLYTTNQITSNKEFKDLNDSFETFIVGSDQVFRAEWVTNRWFLDFVKIQKNKVAVSASFGTDCLNVDKKREKEIEFLLSRFNSISIREKSGVKLCEKIGLKANYLIDPVFLLEPQYYLDMLESDNVAVKEPYLFVYFRTMDKEIEETVGNLSRMLKLTCFYADDETPVNVFLNRLKNASYIITDSYHGMCFSLIFNKKFVCFNNSHLGSARYETLLDVLKFNQGRLVEKNESINTIYKAISADEDWEKINSLIKKYRSEGIPWLLNAVNTPQRINWICMFNKYVVMLMYQGMVKRALKKMVKNRLTRKLYFTIIKKGNENE